MTTATDKELEFDQRSQFQHDIEEDCITLRSLAENMDRNRIKMGILIADRGKQYGESYVEAIVQESGLQKSALYSYVATAKLITALCDNKAWNTKNSTRVEFLDNYPAITYTHLRAALPAKDERIFSYEDALDALRALEDGDPRPEFAEFNESLPMSTGMFERYITIIKNMNRKAAGITSKTVIKEPEPDIDPSDYDDGDVAPFGDALWEVLNSEDAPPSAEGVCLAHDAGSLVKTLLESLGDISDNPTVKIVVIIED